MAIHQPLDSWFQGKDETQIQLMEERCILLDEDDNVIGHESKKECHLNDNIFGVKNLLHRAFSVFIFNRKNELLLQKRSLDKITFPSYWANSCCSHPLFPHEADGIEGAKRAAIRKLEQELGIPPQALPLNSFRFLSRVHYKASSDDIWGEHEIDYILFCRPPVDVVPNPNPNEVEEARYFSKSELDSFVALSDVKGDLISPWFRAIHKQFLGRWWTALLDDQLSEFENDGNIYRAGLAANNGSQGTGEFSASFTKSAEGLGSRATTWKTNPGLSNNAGAAGGKMGKRYTREKEEATTQAGTKRKDLKQGAYGKVIIHKHSMWSQLSRIDEVFALCRYMVSPAGGVAAANERITGDEHITFAGRMLDKTSRSFAAVIRQLSEELRVPICIFYLVLRALDTVEDDMTAFEDREEKKAALRDFHKHLTDIEYVIEGVGEGNERALLQHFPHIAHVCRGLDPSYLEVITDITRRMGSGMAEYVDRDLGEGTRDLEDYNLYCYYVAGLVGEGLSALMARSGMEPKALEDRKDLSVAMGRFLQKTNIIRDYLEDLVDGRAFWPSDITGKYTKRLSELAEQSKRVEAVACLNELVTDALEHVPQCLAYMRLVSNPRNFRFCAIPQVMAIATLAEVYDNENVFTGVVKIRKGLAVKLMQAAVDMSAVDDIFNDFAHAIARKIRPEDPNASRTYKILSRIDNITQTKSKSTAMSSLQTLANFTAPALFVFLLGYLFRRRRNRDTLFPQLTDTKDVAALAVMFCVICYLFGFFGMRFVASGKEDEELDQVAEGTEKRRRRRVAERMLVLDTSPQKN